MKKYPLFVFFFVYFIAAPVFSFPIEITDDQGNRITISEKPERAVSLVPSVTEIIFRLGAGDSVRAITYHSIYPSGTAKKDIIGGFFSPSIEKIEEMEPDYIFISGIHKEVVKHFKDKKCKLIVVETDSIAGSYENILLLGKIFNKENKAAFLVKNIKNELEIIEQKVAKIPKEERKRVIRLMGQEKVMTPGKGSFQNEMIRAAGGISHGFEEQGKIITVSMEEWMAFNPQVIYGCYGDKDVAENFFTQAGWKDVEAVKNNMIFYFSCDLTCRASTNTGYFVGWLASSIYGDAFSKKEDQVHEDAVFKSRDLTLDLDYVEDIQIRYSHIHDFVNKTLVIDFNRPMTIVSTIGGQREKITTVGNHYTPPQNWRLGHMQGLETLKASVNHITGKSGKKSEFLFTGADMDNLSVRKEKFKDMEVYALVTAGVRSNAMRMSKDEGMWYEPGTINIIILTNMTLTPRAMTRAIISTTEAKTAALLDMDIRSSYAPKQYRATGTGTDNVMVVQGKGVKIENSGGHTKMGEMIARAAYAGVKDAVYKQNGLITERNIFQRLKERKVTVMGMLGTCDCGKSKSEIARQVESVLLEPRYADFIESSFVISDDYEKGLINDLSTYESWCRITAEEIAEREIEKLDDLFNAEDVPVVLKMALNAIINGVYYHDK